MTVSTFKSTTVAQYLEGVINKSVKSQIEIAAECGWSTPNMVTMVKQGTTKLPLERIGPLAKSLGIDAVHLLRLVMQEYTPETFVAVEAAVGTTILTERERRLINRYRQFTEGTDPEVVVTDAMDVIALVMV